MGVGLICNIYSSGSNKVFGSIIEGKVGVDDLTTTCSYVYTHSICGCGLWVWVWPMDVYLLNHHTFMQIVLMLDISASMKSHFSTLKECVESLLREKPQQLKRCCVCVYVSVLEVSLYTYTAAKFCVSIPSGFNITVSIPSSFNIVAFATAAHLWQDKCIPISDESCTAAVRWVESLKDGGEVCLLEALWVRGVCMWVWSDDNAILCLGGTWHETTRHLFSLQWDHGLYYNCS